VGSRDGLSGEHDNELADGAAALGAEDNVSRHSIRRTRACTDEASGVGGAVEMQMCRKCESMFPHTFTRGGLRWHHQRCEVPEADWVPDGMVHCRKGCGANLKSCNRARHEAKCRGDAEANRTCSKCGRNDFALAPTGLLKMQGMQELASDGILRTGTPVAKAKAKAKAVPKTTAQATNQVRSKAKAKPKEQAKAKPKMRSSIRSRGPHC